MSENDFPQTPRGFDYDPPDGPLAIVHADDDILVLDKPSGLLTVPGKTPDLADCLERRARAQFPGALVVHRLDKDTSGLIVLGLNPVVHSQLSLQFEERRTKKTYEALVWGTMALPSGRVDAPLTSDWPNRPMQKIDHKEGRKAVTDWELIETDGVTSRVRLSPITGRTHQLRVHMASLGHPVIGDNLYAPDIARMASDRLCLHSKALILTHPATARRMAFSSNCPF